MSSKDKKKQPYFDKTWLEHEELRSRMSPQSIYVKSVARQIYYRIWELVPLMKLIQRKLRIFLGAQCHQLIISITLSPASASR